MATSTEIVERAGRTTIRGALYHGIPCQIAAAADRALAEAAWRTLERIDDVFNVYRADSELGAINARGVGTHRISSWLSDCLRLARQVEGLSEGAWCATMLPLVRLWRSAARAGREPDDAELASARTAISPNGWALDGDRLEIAMPGLAFDLGALAKGFAVDLVVAQLRERGVADLLVQVGGETVCLGRSSEGAAHRIGIPHPDDPEGSWCAVLADPGEGLCGSTSGDYRLGHVIGSRTLHHIIDPRSGRPSEVALASVTCVFRGTGRNGLADGLSTAASVLGVAALARFAEATGCIANALRRDPARGLLSATTPGWSALLADG